MRTRVKICGFTRVQDAVAAARLGVDAVGLVFYPPSPRHVNIEQAVAIVKALPAFVSVVALFVDQARAQVQDVLQRVSIDTLQFHGDEKADFCRSFGRSYIKAIAVREGMDIAALEREYRDTAGLLLDAWQPDARGGTGSRFDWNLVPSDSDLPIILAGGLTPENAGQAIAQTRPYALDVSSGVEAGKGVKDAAKMAAFLREVNLQ